VSSPIQISRFDKMLRRMLNVVGRGAVVTTLLEDVFPVMDLMNPAPEMRFLGLEFMAFGHATRNSVEFNAVQLFNPVGSGNLVIIDAVTVLSEDPLGVHAAISTVELSSVAANKQFRDIRAAGVFAKELPVADLRSANDPVGSTILSTIRATIPPLPELSLDSNGIAVAVLNEGSGFTLENDSASTLLRANFFWRERAADPAELRV